MLHECRFLASYSYEARIHATYVKYKTHNFFSWLTFSSLIAYSGYKTKNQKKVDRVCTARRKKCRAWNGETWLMKESRKKSWVAIYLSLSQNCIYFHVEMLNSWRNPEEFHPCISKIFFTGSIRGWIPFYGIGQMFDFYEKGEDCWVFLFGANKESIDICDTMIIYFTVIVYVPCFQSRYCTEIRVHTCTA